MTPEQYWIDRGENVIGTDVLRDGDKARQAATYQAIAQWIVNHGYGAVLDVGCNVGALADFLLRAGFNTDFYMGVDTNPHAVKAAKGRGLKVNVGDLRHLVFPDAAFMYVVVKDVIEHLEGPHLLAEAFRVAREYVVVATYIPWTEQPAEIVQHPDGYYTNRYCWDDILALTAGWGFSAVLNRIHYETNGTPNQILCFRRKQVTA